MINAETELLSRSVIFRELNNDEIEASLKCTDAKKRVYKKGAYVYRDGDRSDSVCVILDGEILIQKTDFNGNANIIARYYPPQMFAGASAFTKAGRVPFDALCATDSTILFLNCDRLVRVCTSSCAFHTQIIKNLIGALAEKNLSLTEKITVLTKRTIREKLLQYLHTESIRAKSPRFTVSLSRAQLADFLSVDRSALSRELSAMSSDGIIEFNKNKFTLK